MENKKDNIDKLVSGMLEQPDLLKRTLQNLATNTEKSYIVFRDVRDSHADIGRAALPAMLRNQSSHVVKDVAEAAASALAHWIKEHPDTELRIIPRELYKILVNDTQVYQNTLFNIATILAPQFIMFDERYMRENIETELTETSSL